MLCFIRISVFLLRLAAVLYITPRFEVLMGCISFFTYYNMPIHVDSTSHSVRGPVLTTCCMCH